MVPCEFPFKFKGNTYYGCISWENNDPTSGTTGTTDPRNPSRYGRTWCSTKVSGSDREHVGSGEFYGECDSKCPNQGARSPKKSKFFILLLCNFIQYKR